MLTKSGSRGMCGVSPILLVAVIVVFAGCSPPATENSTNKQAGKQTKPFEKQDSPGDRGIHFIDLAEKSGIRFTYRNGEEAEQAAMLESMGGGVALFDYDSDGNLDLFFPGGGEFEPIHVIRGRPPALFRNGGDGLFLEVSRSAGLGKAPFYSHGTAVGDFDEDGFPDLLVTGYGGVLLFHNCGDGTFEDVAQTAGLVLQSFSTSAAWGDVNGDGVLDLYVTNYVNWSFQNHPYCDRPELNKREVCNPRDFEPLPDIFYAGKGDGTFRDASREAGLQPGGKGLGVLLGDFDLDGDLDAYIGNDTTPNYLYRNDGGGRLSEVGITSGAALSDFGTSDGSMGVDLADFNLDGLPDLWVTNFEMESLGLYRNEGGFTFRHVSRAFGLRAVGLNFIAFGTVFFDMDRDGDEDVFVTNGHVNHYPVDSPRKQRPLLFENRQGKRFENIAPSAGPYLSEGHLGRGVAVGDLDNDGDLDLMIGHTNDPAAVLSNESKNRNHWIGLRLIGTTSHRDAVGAIVGLVTDEGEQIRQVKGGTSYLSASDPRVFFGLGEAQTIDRISIRWPSGIVQELRAAKVDRYHLIHETKMANTKSADSE